MIPCRTDKILTTSATDSYAKKLVTTLPQLSDSDKKKYAKTPRHAPIKCNQFIMDDPQFPPLPMATTKPNNGTRPTDKSTQNINQTQPTNQTATTSSDMVDLKAIQEEIKCNLQIDLTALVQKAIEPVQNDINTSMAKLDMRYDKLSHTVQKI